MKKLAVIVFAFILGITSAFGVAFEKKGNSGGKYVGYSSEKPLFVDHNYINILLQKDGANITDAKVKIKVFMPEMPGMPEMEYDNEAKSKDGRYEAMINFSMSGTWQVRIEFEVDGKKYLHKSSVIL